MDLKRTAVVLGGGFFPDGSLTNLSKQRLDAGIRLYQEGQINHLVVLGERKSTYFSHALQYDKPGAEKRAEYLLEHGVLEKDILKIIGGRDTIGEAIACRESLPSSVKSFLLITSEIHMPRAMWIFRKVLGKTLTFSPYGVPCGGILLPEEEKEYLVATQNYFQENTSILNDVKDWHNRNCLLYTEFKAIHDKFHPAGKESEAYLAVSKDNP